MRQGVWRLYMDVYFLGAGRSRLASLECTLPGTRRRASSKTSEAISRIDRSMLESCEPWSSCFGWHKTKYSKYSLSIARWITTLTPLRLNISAAQSPCGHLRHIAASACAGCTDIGRMETRGRHPDTDGLRSIGSLPHVRPDRDVSHT